MTDPARFTGVCLTLAQYRALEAAGRIRRPLTDDPIGSDPTRRQTDAATSAIHTAPDTTIPVDWVKPPRPRTPPRVRRPAPTVPVERQRDPLGRFAPYTATDETPAPNGPRTRQRRSDGHTDTNPAKETA